MPGTQESKAPTPLLRQSGIRKLIKNQRKTKGFQRSRGVQSWAGVQIYVFGAKNCLCRDLSRAAGGLVSQRFDKRFQAFRGLLRPLEALFSRFRGLPRLLEARPRPWFLRESHCHRDRTRVPEASQCEAWSKLLRMWPPQGIKTSVSGKHFKPSLKLIMRPRTASNHCKHRQP